MLTRNFQSRWRFIIPILILFTLSISISPWLTVLIATPPDRVFSGIHWWSPDYFTYLSYVELGRRGGLGVRLLQTTLQQKPVYAHLAHTLSGLFFGNMLQLNSIFSYHLARVFYGLIFLSLAAFFNFRFTKSRIMTLFAFIFSFYISGFVKVEQLFPLKISRYLAFMFGSDIVDRSLGPLHYTAGYIFFMITILWFFHERKSSFVKTLIFAILLNLTLLANPFAFIIAAFSFVIYIVIRLFLIMPKMAQITRELIEILFGFISTIPVLFYFQYVLSIEPWGQWSTSFKFYYVSHPPITAVEVIMGLFPLLFCGFFGIAGIASRKIKSSLTASQFTFFVSWILSHFILLFFGDRIKIDPLRSNQGLYYLPLSIFAAYFIAAISKKLKVFIPLNHKIIGLILLFFIILMTLPNYILTYRSHLYSFTDLKNFSLIVAPTQKQVEAFYWLEKHTPVASGVLALYEAAELIPGFSANAVQLTTDQKVKTEFYSGMMSEGEAQRYIKDNNFRYVYLGYQELFYGGGVMKYPFLKKVFENSDVKIYQVMEDKNAV